MINNPHVDAAEIVARLGQFVIQAAEKTGQVEVETAAYDAVGHLIMGSMTAHDLLLAEPVLEMVREPLLQLAQQLELILHNPAQHTAR